MITENANIRCTKGCPSLGFQKGAALRVLRIEVQERNRAYVVLESRTGVRRGFYAQHTNRLADPEVRLAYADPTKSICVQVIR